MTSAEDDFGAFFESLLEGDQTVSRCGGRSPTLHPSLCFPLHDQQEQQQADKLKPLVEQHQHQPHQQHQQDQQQQQQDQQQQHQHPQHEQQRQHEQPQKAGPQWAADNVAQPEEARKESRQQHQQEGRATERQQLQQFLHRAQSDEQQHTEFQREQPREQQQAKTGGKQQLEAAVSSLSPAAAALSKYEAKQRPQQHVRMQQADSAAAPSSAADILRSGDAATSTSSQTAAVERRESNAPAVAVDNSAHATFATAAGPRDRATAGDCASAASSEGGAAAAATAVPAASRGGDPAETAAESSSAANAVELAQGAGPLTARAVVISSAAAVPGAEGLDGRAAAETPAEDEQRQPVSALVAYPARLPSSNKLSSAAACADASASRPRENPAACSPAAAAAVSLVAEAIRGGPSAHACERVPPLPSADGGVATSSRPLQLQPARQQSLGTVDCSSSGSGNNETSSSREYLSRSNSSDSFLCGESFERKGFEEETRAAIAALKSRRTSTAEEANTPAGAPSCATTAAAVAAGERGAVQEQQQKGNEQQTAAAVKRAAAEETFLQELCQPPGRKTRKVVLPNLGLGEEQEWQQPQEPQRPQGPQPQAGRWWSAPPELDPFPPYRFSMRESETGRDEASSSRTSSGSSKGSSGSRSSLWNSKSLSSKKANSSKGSDCKTDRQSSSGGSGTPLETVQQDMAFSAEAVSRVIEAKLLENQQMIFAIHENLGGGRFEQAVCFFERLQQNLLFLALLADQQPEQQLGKLRAPEQQDQGASEGGDVMGEREQQDFYQNNADFWNHEETQRLYHALRTPYLDLRQLSAAVYSKDPQQVLTYLMRTADCYLNYSRGIPDPGFEGNGLQPQVQLPQKNSRSGAGQEQSFLAGVGSRDRRLATQTSVSGELPKCTRVPHQLTLQKTEPCSESWGAPAVDGVHRNLREDTKVRQQPQQQKQRPPDQSDTLCDDPGGREAAEQVEGPPDRQSDDLLAVKEKKIADGSKTAASP